MSNTIFRIDEVKNRKGEVIYQVLGASSRINKFWGIWDAYTKENKTLDEAIEHIKTLYKLGVESKKTVYKTTVKKLSIEM